MRGNEIASANGANGKVTALYAFGIPGGVTAGSVCVLINEGRGRRNDRTCYAIGSLVASTLTGILNFVDSQRNDAHLEGSRSAVLSLTANVTLVEKLAAILDSQDLEYGGLESLPVTNLHPGSNGTPSLIEHVLIKDVKIEGLTFNLIHATFDNGDGHVFLSPSDPKPSPGNLQKRHDGAGFKITFTTRVHSGLGRSQKADLANGIANAWDWEAEHNNMGQFIGLVKLADRHQAIVYFRIISEVRGYGENYESVDVCGGMAGFI